MRCKCKYDSKQLDTKDAFKIVIKDKNTYWCSEECYNLYLQEQERQAKIKAEYDEIFETIKEIFGYEFNGHSLLQRELKAWEKLTTRQKIILYLKENKTWLSTVMSKEFNGDYNRIKYFSAVISSRLHDFKPKTPETPKPKVVVDETIYESPVHSLNKRRSLADLEDDL